MELIAIVAMLALSVVLGVAGTRAILGLMFAVMMRARTAHDYGEVHLHGAHTPGRA